MGIKYLGSNGDRLFLHLGRGLNIGSLLAKNLALLGKWWWRLRNEGEFMG